MDIVLGLEGREIRGSERGVRRNGKGGSGK